MFASGRLLYEIFNTNLNLIRIPKRYINLHDWLLISTYQQFIDTQVAVWWCNQTVYVKIEELQHIV